MQSIPLSEWLGLCWFLLLWQGYEFINLISRRAHGSKSLSGLMDGARFRWMQVMIQRESRIFDAQLQAALLAGVGFFASTTLVAIGGLLALLGSANQMEALLDSHGFGGPVAWHLKVFTIIGVFIFAFMKFAWAYRLFNYVFILMGAEPEGRLDPAAAAPLGRLHGFAATHFSSGLRAFYYAIALIFWFHSIYALCVATTLLTAMLYFRDEHSAFSKEVLAFSKLKAPQ